MRNIALPEIKKLRFGDENQIKAIRDYQEKVDELEKTYQYEVSVEIDSFSSGFVSGFVNVMVEALSDEEAEEKAVDEAYDALIGLIEFETNISKKEKLVKEEEEKEMICLNNLCLFEGVEN